jgi:hypothetical protein
MKQIVITKKQIRRLPKTDRYKGVLEYTTSKGGKRSVIFCRETKEEVIKQVNFRINGLKNGGVPVVTNDPRIKL